MGIIDFRMRPLYKGYEAFVNNGTTAKFLSALCCRESASIQEKSLALLVKEMDEAGIDLAVVPGRQSPGTFITNDELFEIKKQYPGRFEIFPLYDPLRKEESMEEIIRYMEEEHIKGVSIEPGFGNELRFDDKEYAPLYELLNSRKMVLMATFSGSITRTLDASLPGRFQAVAKDYPDISMVAGHGGWPWVREMLCIAFFTPNIYLAPDLYSCCPGWQDWKEAAGGIARERMLFGSSYPLLTVEKAVETAKSWNLDQDAEEKLLYKNAARLLGREDTGGQEQI